MKLKKKVKNLDDVPEALRSLYVKQGEEYVLDMEGDDPNANVDELKELRRKVGEFRDNNVTYKQQVEKLQEQLKRFEGVDPEKWADAKMALEALEKIEEKDLIKGGKIDEVIERRLATYKKQIDAEKSTLQKRVEALDKQNKDYTGKYKQLKIRTEVATNIQKVAQPRQGALDDILNRAERIWDLGEDDSLTAKGLFNSDGKPMSVEEWGQDLAKNAPYLFEPSQGGGSSGGTKQQGTKPGQKRIIANNPVEIGRNAKDIASGAAVVEGMSD